MKQGWTYKSLGDCIDKVPKQKQVKSKDYQSSGKYPIVSQERDLISGYWDDESFLYKHEKPVIIFGDHTKEIKYIDFDFVVGADGTQILSPKSNLNAKFFYYALLATPIRTLGYARHFKLLKEKSFPVPFLSEQERIVERLDAAFAQIDELKSNAERQLAEARALFQSALTQAMQPKPGWQEKTVGEIFETYAGGTPIKSEKSYYENGMIPWIRSGEVCKQYITESEMFITEAGLKNSSAKLYPVNTVLVAMYGATAAQVGILKFEATSNQAVCGILPHKNYVPEFVYYWFKSIQNFLASQAQGGAQPNISQQKIKKVKIPTIPLEEQHAIVIHLDSLSLHVRELEEISRKTAAECDALKQALLRQIFE